MRGRFAPSPTGLMHLGNIWTAFLCWLQVRQHDGVLVLRMEDIDTQRSRTEFADMLLDDLRWLGLNWDEGPDIGGSYGPYIQHERRMYYDRAVDQLEQRGLLYPCYCTRARLQNVCSAPHEGELSVYDGHCYTLRKSERAKMTKTPAWRVHVPDETITFTDGILGRKQEFLPRDCGDFIIRRADGMYAYQLAVSVDDGEMGITHVLRGRDLASSTARQIWLMRLLGYTPPAYTHVPMLVDEAGNRLSKRQQGVTVRYLRSCGITGAQILSYLAFQGGLTNHYEMYSVTELLQHCSFRDMKRNNILIHSHIAEEIRNISENRQ